MTGVFGSNPLEPMPPTLIYDTKSKTAEGMRIKSTWANNLPEVVGFWGFGRATRIDSQVCIKKRQHG